jgi:NTE family protein
LPGVTVLSEPGRHGAQTILVLGGGNALGSYLAGAYETLSGAGIEPDWIVGASAGALMGAIIAGNRPEQRLPRLREFWDEAMTKTGPAPFANEKLRQHYNGWHALWSVVAGRPAIFRHRWPGLWSALPGVPDDVALFDHGPLRATLERLVDFNLLNNGAMRFTVCCIDVETGEEVRFDTTRDRIGPEHLLASSALMPGFPPIEIDGRSLCDPGFVNNTPVDVAFLSPPAVDTLCIVVELFSLRSPAPKSLDASLERGQDLIFASPTRRAIEALQREYALRAQLDPALSDIKLLHLAYRTPGHELAAKTIDFSPSSIRERWAAGSRDADSALSALRSSRKTQGLAYIPIA